MWSKSSNKKGWDNKYQNQQQSDKKENGDPKSNNRFNLVDNKWMCLYNKGCGFNTPHTTGFHDTRATYVKNNQPLAFPFTHVFQKKMVSASGTFPQFASNNGGGT